MRWTARRFAQLDPARRNELREDPTLETENELERVFVLVERATMLERVACELSEVTNPHPTRKGLSRSLRALHVKARRASGFASWTADIFLDESEAEAVARRLRGVQDVLKHKMVDRWIVGLGTVERVYVGSDCKTQALATCSAMCRLGSKRLFSQAETIYKTLQRWSVDEEEEDV